MEYLGYARQVDQRQIKHVRRVYAQVDRYGGDALVAAGHAVRLVLDLLAHRLEVNELLALAVEELGVLGVLAV